MSPQAVLSLIIVPLLSKVLIDKLEGMILPACFEILRLRDGIAEPCAQVLGSICSCVRSAFQVTAKLGTKYDSFVETIALAGYYTSWCDRQQITDNDLILNRSVFVTANARAVTRLLLTDDKQIQFEQILDNHDFGHLITIKLISYVDTTFMEV